MWSRKLLKDRAKEVLRASYWKAFLVSLIIAVVGGDSGSGSFNFRWNLGNNSSFNNANPFTWQNSEVLPIMLFFIIAIASIIILFALAFRVFLGYPLEVGGRRYFIQSAQGNVDMNNLGYGFGKGKYLDIIKAMFWRALLNFLWFLLLIIPGIVKYYAYSMVPYILSDNPNIVYNRAVELSKNMTNGQKFDMWVLDLSFIGWYILGTLALLVGVLFVLPYENATKAELYLTLRQNALDNGLCSYDELTLDHPQQTVM